MERSAVSEARFIAAEGEDLERDPRELPWRSAATRLVEAHMRPFRVLLAEDDAAMRSVVAEALRGDGYEVVELSDGGRLLVDVSARLKAGHGDDSLDLIVSDIRMPVCTGLQILAALRDAHWRTPVILMTAFGDEATRRHAETLRAVLFDKPFDVDDLRTCVANLLPRNRPSL
jgi:CheY-like chemotaxis protein